MRYWFKLLAAAAMLAVCTNSAKTVRAEERPSDNSITTWVEDALRDDPRIVSSRIDVSTSDGIVALSGTLKSITAKKYADREAKKVKGVLGVINNLSVEPEYRYDWDITQDIRHRLVNSEFVRSHDLAVTVHGGVATLAGKVDSWAQREWAEMLAGEVRGVRSIDNDLKVELPSHRPDKEIANDVVATISRDAYLTGLPITATVRDGMVTLTGSVGNLHQKDRARDHAGFVSGVVQIKNNLKVEWWKERGVREHSPSASDDELAAAVRDELYQDSRVNPSDLRVEVSRRDVTLRGSVPAYHQREVAEQDAREVVGVNWVTNRLTVNTHPRSDESIKQEIISDYNSDYSLNDEDIDVGVHDGVVTLSGNVSNDNERIHADRVASRAAGVYDVVNLIQVTPPPKYADLVLEQEIKDRLRHDAETRWVADQIGVHVHNGKATLDGTVLFWSERDEANHVATLTDGIWSVDNEITVTG